MLTVSEMRWLKSVKPKQLGISTFCLYEVQLTSSGCTFILWRTSSGIQKTGLTSLICSSPNKDSPAIPNKVWNGSTWEKKESLCPFPKVNQIFICMEQSSSVPARELHISNATEQTLICADTYWQVRQFPQHAFTTLRVSQRCLLTDCC